MELVEVSLIVRPLFPSHSTAARKTVVFVLSCCLDDLGGSGKSVFSDGDKFS